MGRSWNSFYSLAMAFRGVPAGRPVWPGTCYTPGDFSVGVAKGSGDRVGSPLTLVETPRLSNAPSRAGQFPTWHGCLCCHCHEQLLESSRRHCYTEDCPGLPKGCCKSILTEEKEKSCTVNFPEFGWNGHVFLSFHKSRAQD